MRIAVALLLVAACKKDPCEQAGKHMFGAIAKHTQAWLSLTDEEMDVAKTSLVEDCKMRPWDEGASSCVGRAIDAKDLEGCAAMRNVDMWRDLVIGQVDPNGQKRYAEIDAVISELVAADKAVAAEPGECKGAVPVVAVDRTIVESLVTKQKLPEKVHVVGEWSTTALTRYALKQQVTPGEMNELRKWIKQLPKDRAWGIVEAEARIEPQVKDAKTFIEGEYLGTIHVVDGAKQTPLCQRAFSAHSSESVKTYFIKDRAVIGIEEQLQSDFRKNINEALDERLDKLRKGEPDPAGNIAPFQIELVVPGTKWMCTQSSQFPEITLCAATKKACESLREGHGDEYVGCTEGGNVACMSFHDKVADQPNLSCHTTMATCAVARRVMVDNAKIDRLSRCRHL